MTKVQALRATTGPRKEVLVVGLNESMIATKSLSFERWKIGYSLSESSVKHCKMLDNFWIETVDLKYKTAALSFARASRTECPKELSFVST